MKLKPTPINREHCHPPDIDNRLGELSSWEEKTLAIEWAEIIELGVFNIEAFGWGTGEVDFILDDGTVQAPTDDPVDAVPALPKCPILPPSRQGF